MYEERPVVLKGSEQPHVEQQLRMAWLQQLRVEYADICFQYRIELQPPVFTLTDSRSCLGSWDTNYRLLSISSFLIRSCPWNITLQVFKHEMAHQICAEIFSRPDGNHGRLFRQACQLIGVPEPFTRARADSASSLQSFTMSDAPRTARGRNVLSKVEKLLALAGSDNEYEAALAMQKAGELLTGHNLSLGMAEDKAAYQHLVLKTERQRMPGYLRGVCALLQDFFFVQVIVASIYDPEKNITLRTIELFGRPENVAVAEHCYYFLRQNLTRLWQNNKHQFSGSRQRARNSYFHGVVSGFRAKLAGSEQGYTHSRPEAGEHVSALVVAEDQELQRFIANSFPRIRIQRRRTIHVNREAYHQAVATGKTLVLHRPLESFAPNGGFLE